MTKINNPSKIIVYWLLTCAFMVMCMTGIGAVTRLTESGLSITEWNVVSGTIPPLNEAKWLEEFEKYKQFPEYIKKNQGMSLDEFKNIYFWEWFHRFWGRLIGLAYALPLIFFWVKGWIPQPDKPKYIGLLALGGLQACMGWIMVKSGLIDRPSVSHFKLAAHLSLALVIYSCLIWMALRNSNFTKREISCGLRWHGFLSLGFVALTIIWGAFVAGLDAGMIYNSFPLMGGAFVPPEFGQTPFLSDPASVQFTHRILAYATGLVVFLYGLRWMKHSPKVGIALSLWVIVQIGLGIATLLTIVSIPLATLHQLGAVVLLTLIVMSLYRGSPSRATIS
jgi:cytochrome c oxidase assembly protein subunit 15